MESESKKRTEQQNLALFLQYERLVGKVWFDKFQRFKGEKDDLMQCGRIGLWNACITYKPEKCNKFITYAYWCIRNEMAMYLRKELKYQNRHTSYEIRTEDGKIKNVLDYLDDGQYEQMLGKAEFGLMLDRVRHKDNIKDLYNGMNMAEIARKDGVTKEAIRMRLFRDRAKIEYDKTM